MSAMPLTAAQKQTWPEVRVVPMSNRSKPALYSITSSARASSVSGASRPSAFAVFKLSHQLIFGRCLHRRVGGFLAFEDAVDIAGSPLELAASGQTAATPRSVMNSRRRIPDTGFPSPVGLPHLQPAIGSAGKSYG